MAVIPRNSGLELARLALADGDLVAVQRWITGLDRSGGQLFPFAAEQEMLMLARWHLAQGRREAALQLLQDLERAAQETGRRRCLPWPTRRTSSRGRPGKSS